MQAEQKKQPSPLKWARVIFVAGSVFILAKWLYDWLDR